MIKWYKEGYYEICVLKINKILIEVVDLVKDMINRVKNLKILILLSN